MTIVARRVQTAWRRLQEGGVPAVTRLTVDVARRWLRRQRRFATVEGCRFSLNGLPDSMVQLLLSGKYEAAERAMLIQDLDRDLPVVELGGCIGVLACIINRRLTDPARHVVVEADARLRPALVANRKRNGCRFTVVSKAIAYNGTRVRFSAEDEFLFNRVVHDTQGTEVEATALKTLLEDNAISECTLICDIEGTEYDIVTQELSVLTEHVRHLIFEAHPKILGAEKIEAMLTRLRLGGFTAARRVADTYAFFNATLPPRPDANSCRSGR